MSGSTAQLPPNRSRTERLRDLLPDLIALVKSRIWVLTVGMVLIALSRLASMTPPLALKVLIDKVIHGRDRTLLPFIVGAMLGASLFQQLSGFVLQRMFSRSTNRFIGELRCKLQTHVMRLSLLYHDSNKSGALASRIMNDVQGLQNLVGAGLLSYFGSVMTCVIALGLMTRVNALLGLVAVFAIVAIGAVIARGTKRVRAIARERNDLFADTFGRLAETIGGVRVVKTYRAEAREEAVFADWVARIVDNQLKSVNLNTGLNLTTGLIWGSVGGLVVWIGTDRILSGEVTLGRQLTLGDFIAFNALLGYAVAPLLQIVGIGNMLMEALAGLERTRLILNEPREDQNPRRTEDVGTLRGEVVFDDVSFSYTPDKPVLHEISFRAEPGTVTALVGPSGSGKSTTIGLIASFYDPTSGKILVDGKDLSMLRLEPYRAQLGVVLQETFLFAGSILENVAFARPGAKREEILSACRSARVDEFAEKMAEGYDTLVGERGVKLSGGQRQRISIARALLADPRILILDEATSSLDTQSEALIQAALAELLVGRTTFVIAHRLSTIRRADQILVIDAGRIKERGSHEALLAARGLYAEMYTRQHDVEADLFLAPGEGGTAEPPRARLEKAAGEDAGELVLP